MVSGDIAVDDTDVDTPPALTVPLHVVAEATGPAGAKVSYSASASDDEDPSPRVVCSPASGDVFPLGLTNVSCTATDAAGHVSRKQFPVLVRARTQQAVVGSATFESCLDFFCGGQNLDVVAVSGAGGAGLTGTVSLGGGIFRTPA